MKYLLTSAGIKNKKLHETLLGLLGMPISEANALCIPTSSHAMRTGTKNAYKFITGKNNLPMVDLGWKSVGVLELTALPSVGRDIWLPQVMEADVFLVGGGDPLFLNYWMVNSGFAEILPTLGDKVYCGLSAGSMVLAPNIGEDFVNWRPLSGGDETLGIVGFSIFPHLDHPNLPENTLADAKKWAAGMTVPCYAIDDESGIKVIGDQIEVITEGHWHFFPQQG